MPGDDEEPDPVCPCGKKLSTNFWLGCSVCETTWHTACCGLDGLTQAPINKLIAKKWKCPRCFKFSDEIPAEMKEQNKPSQLSTEMVESIISIVNSTVEENLKTLLTPENLENEPEQAENHEDFIPVDRRRRKRHNSIQVAIQEQREEEILIEKKKDNLIIYGVPELPTDDKKEEMNEDFRRVKKVYAGKVVLQKEDLSHMTRLGIKENGKTRPIQITLVSQNKRTEMLTKNMNLKLLENDESTNIYVSTDRTKKQRAEYKALKKVLDEKKKTNPNLVIRNNKIVPFRPAAQAAPTWASLFD